MAKPRSAPIPRRLILLYASAFLQGMVLWYAIEKLFMTSIGFNTATIGIAVAIMSVVILAVETPSGVLADRWSRKGVMLLGCGALFVSALAGGLSYSAPMYMINFICWGIYAALYSGTYDSVIYDVTLEEHGNSDRYEYYLSRSRMVEGLSFVTGALGGGLISGLIGMRAVYWISLPFVIVAGILLVRFREPTLHKAEVTQPLVAHIGHTFSAVLRRRSLLPLVVATVGFAVLLEILFELSQLWFIALAMPLVVYGAASAILFSTWTIGGTVVRWLHSRAGGLVGLGVIFSAILGLMYAREYWVNVAEQFLLGAALVAYGVILSRRLHDELPSRIRAGSASVMSTLARVILIPLSVIFTSVANDISVFRATGILLGIAVIAVTAYVMMRRTKN